VRVDVVPKLPEEGLVGVVLDVGLLVCHLEQCSAWIKEDEERSMPIVKRKVRGERVSEEEVAVLRVNPYQLLKESHALRFLLGFF
jgi:hypothetical protein